MISICVRAGFVQRVFHFEKAEISIGRTEENDLPLLDERVSKRHCKLILLEDRYHILDLKSTNGCFVNGSRILGYSSVNPYDKIRIGDHILWIITEFEQTELNITEIPPWSPLERGRLPRSASGPENRPDVSRPELRLLIEELFLDDADLDAFCIDHYHEIKKRFSLSMTRTTKINILLERADPVQLRQLLYSELNKNPS